MISVLFMFWNHVHPDKDKPVSILRIPQVKSLRALDLGLTLALICAGLNILTHPFFLDLWPNFLMKIVFLTLLFIFAGLGGWFVFIMMLFYSYFAATAPLLGRSWSDTWFAELSRSFGNGFLFGALFATIYNDLMYLHTRILRRHTIKHSFTFHPAKKFDIVKSPIKTETTQAVDRPSPYEPVYKYEINQKTAPKHPYTIAFIANPCIQVSQSKDANAMPDPIMKNRDIFFQNVDKALASFETNEVLGRPEIWSRIRIVVFYDDDLKDLKNANCSFVKTCGPEIIQDNDKAEHLLYPQPDMRERLLKMIGDPETNKIGTLDIREIDVIFALSAHPTHIRSTARYSIYNFPKDRPPIPIPDFGHLFVKKPKPKPIPIPLPVFKAIQSDKTSFGTSDPQDDKINFSNWLSRFFINFPNFLSPVANVLQDISFFPPIKDENENDKKELYYPEDYADYPGLVALNIIGASSKTYIHEFAHAMSATGTGIIVDEFYDQIETDEGSVESSPSAPTDYTPAFYVNRLERKNEISTRDLEPKFFKNLNISQDTVCVPPIPKEFRIYNEQTYNTDLNHPSAEENWLGYFPERPETSDGCIMDRTYGTYAFDKLLQKFIYDRLLVKINRKAPPQ